MSSTHPDLSLALPPALAPIPQTLPPIESESLISSAKRGYRALRQRWLCLGPECPEREGLRSWIKLPSRMRLQDGWCCSPECLQAAVEALAADKLRRIRMAPTPHTHRVPLGLTLLSRGTITAAQLRTALEAQQTSRGERRSRIGEWLIRQHAASEEEIAAGVGLQWARPTFPLERSQGWLQCRGWVPLPVMEALRMLPLHFVAAQRKLYVGFTQSIDFHALNALSLIFECKTESCIVTDSALDRAFEEMRGLNAMRGAHAAEDIAIERVDGAGEVARITRQYARLVQARQIRMAALGPFLWVRLRGERIVHITFRSND